MNFVVPFSNRVFTEGTCKLLNLVISDLVDEDYVLHGRCQPVSALLFGTAALLSKPGQTLAPVIGMWLISYSTGSNYMHLINSCSLPEKYEVLEKLRFLGYDIFDSQVNNLMWKSEGIPDDVISSHLSQSDFRYGVFHVLVSVPIVCALLQLTAWAHFSLKGGRLDWVKQARSGLRYSLV